MKATVAQLPYAGVTQEITYRRGFVLAAMAYVLITMARLHEIVPQLGPLRLGMLSSIAVFFLGLGAIRRDILNAILSSIAGRGLLVVVAFCALTIPTAEWPKASFDYLTKIYYNSVILFIVTAAAFADRRAMRLIVTALVVDVGLAGLAAIQKATQGRYEIGQTYDPNETASLFVMTVPWAIYLLMTEKGAPRLVGMLAIPACLIGILESGSRGGLLGFIALVPFLIFLSPPKRRGPFILFVVLGAVLTVSSMGDQAVYRFRKAFDTKEYNYTTDDGRIEIWKRGLGYIKGSPVVGVGIDGFQYKELNSKSNKGFGIRQAAAHNMYIQVAAELGLIGFGAFLTMLFGGLGLAATAARRYKKAIAQGVGTAAEHGLVRANMAQACLFSLMCTGFFLSLGYSAMVYFSVAACVGVWIGSRNATQGPGQTASVAPRSGVRGMRGWRSARPVPVSAGVHGMHTPQS